MPVEHVATLSTPIGVLSLCAQTGLLSQVAIGVGTAAILSEEAVDCPVLAEARIQFVEYFAARRTTFELPLKMPDWPPFSLRVLEALCAIPFGEVRSYGEVARLAGSPGAARAVGQVMAANPLPIILPCHRVIAAGGLPGGYSGGGGLATKGWLLDFERRHAGR